MPERSRGPGSPLRQHAPWWEYVKLGPRLTPEQRSAAEFISLLQLQRTSLQPFGSVEGWQRAWLQQQREKIRKQAIRNQALHMKYYELPVHQQEQLCRQLALHPFTKKQVRQGALMTVVISRSKELGCWVCGRRTFGAYGLVAHCRAKHPNVVIRIWEALDIAL